MRLQRLLARRDGKRATTTTRRKSRWFNARLQRQNGGSDGSPRDYKRLVAIRNGSTRVQLSVSSGESTRVYKDFSQDATDQRATQRLDGSRAGSTRDYNDKKKVATDQCATIRTSRKSRRINARLLRLDGKTTSGKSRQIIARQQRQVTSRARSKRDQND